MKLRILLLTSLLSAALFLSGCGKADPIAEPDYSSLDTNTPAPPIAPVPAASSNSTASTAMVRLDSKPGSQVRIEGTSTLHDWQVIGKLIGGYAELPGEMLQKEGPALKPGKTDIKADLFVPVRSMRSITKDGAPYSTQMDDIMYEKLLATAHPKIFYRSKEVTVKSAPAAAGEAYLLDTKGELVVAGVTNMVAMPVKIYVAADGTVRITGDVATKMSAFNIKPPAPVGILIQTGDDVKLLFDWVVARKAPTGSPVSSAATNNPSTAK